MTRRSGWGWEEWGAHLMGPHTEKKRRKNYLKVSHLVLFVSLSVPLQSPSLLMMKITHTVNISPLLHREA